MPSTRKDFGNDLLGAPGIRQPTGSLQIDAYGVAQAQLTFAIDSSPSNVTDIVDYYQGGVSYPDDVGFPLTSYRYSISSNKAGIAMITVDYMGIARGVGYSDPQIHGVINTTSQAIETHPNFTKVPEPNPGYVAGPLAGYPDDVASQKNNAMWGDPDENGNQPFRGFGITKKDQAINKKAGIRQYLRPMTTVRGVMFFRPSQQAKAEKLSQNVGCYFNTTDGSILVQPDVIYGVVYGSRWLLTAANIECIGTPSDIGTFAALKVTYDMMYGGKDGWDKDIYLQGENIFG